MGVRAEHLADMGDIAGPDGPSQQRRRDSVELHDQQPVRGLFRGVTARAVATYPMHEPDKFADERVLGARVGQPVDQRGEHDRDPRGDEHRRQAGQFGVGGQPERDREHDRLYRRANRECTEPAEHGGQSQQQWSQQHAHPGHDGHQPQDADQAFGVDARHQPEGEAQHDERRHNAA